MSLEANKLTVQQTLSPLLASNLPVDWLFVFKFNAASMPGTPADFTTTGIFDAPGITRPDYDEVSNRFSRHYIYASSNNPTLQLGKGDDVVGSSLDDPLGATFGQVYLVESPPYFLLWNDQFYGQPIASGASPWGHSKGMLAWDDNGEGFVLQVSTPSWPAAGNKQNPRTGDGNTLGWVKDDNIEFSQHFFALKLRGDDVANVLSALHTASVCTDPTNPVLTNNGGPAYIKKLVNLLGKRQKGTEFLNIKLTSGARLIAKPSFLTVPPWQMVSALLGGIDLRVASWWDNPQIYSTTTAGALPACWDSQLGMPGAVEIATTGCWDGKTLGLVGGSGPEHNHAKLGVATSGGKTYSIFGDMNQQGALRPGYAYPQQKCSSSQNGRGGLFFVMEDETLFQGLSSLLAGDSAPTTAPPKSTRKMK